MCARTLSTDAIADGPFPSPEPALGWHGGRTWNPLEPVWAPVMGRNLFSFSEGFHSRPSPSTTLQFWDFRYLRGRAASDCQDGTSLLDEPLEQASCLFLWDPLGMFPELSRGLVGTDSR